MSGKCYQIKIENRQSGNADVYVNDIFVERFTGRHAIEQAAKKIEELQIQEQNERSTDNFQHQY